MLYFDPILKKVVYDNPFGKNTPPPPIGSFTVPPYIGGMINRKKAQEVRKGEFGDMTLNQVNPLDNEDPCDISQDWYYEKGGTKGEVIMSGEFPLHIKRKEDENYFTFPIEPLVSLNYKNSITRRYVAKSDRRGSIKERWSMDDFDISISGVLKNEDGTMAFPEDKIKTLLEIIQSSNEITIKSDFLQKFNITAMVIESVNFPHTKGRENQLFEIKGYSDYSYQLLIEN